MDTVTSDMAKISLAPAAMPTFFGLPAELRNCIYRYAVVEEDEIIIEKSTLTYQEPGITRTSRQARQECLSIFYKENAFIINVIDCKPIQPPSRIHWLRDVAPKAFLIYSGVYHWENLKESIKQKFHHGGVDRKGVVIQDNPKFEKDTFAPIAAYVIMNKMRKVKGCKWEQVEEMLEAFKRGTEAAKPDFWSGTRQCGWDW